MKSTLFCIQIEVLNIDGPDGYHVYQKPASFLPCLEKDVHPTTQLARDSSAGRRMKCLTAELGQKSAQIILSITLANILPGTVKQESSYR